VELTDPAGTSEVPARDLLGSKANGQPENEITLPADGLLNPGAPVAWEKSPEERMLIFDFFC
jgi:hypothetical protein